MKGELRCPVCSHFDVIAIDRFLSLPAGTPGKRGARSLAEPFGLDRRDLALHEKSCLTDERRERLLASLRSSGEGGGGAS